MIHYKVKYDIATKAFTVTNESADSVLLSIGFTDNGQTPVTFNNLKYGREIVS